MSKREQIPSAHVAKCDENTPLTAEQKPLPKGISDKPFEEKSPAEWAYERMILYIQNFEEQLDNEHEVGIGLTGGDVGLLRIEGIGYFDPDIVTFYGTDSDGTKTQLIQHVSQLNVMLRAEPRRETKEPPNRIGFRLAADLGRHTENTQGDIDDD